MGSILEEIDESLRRWIARQPMFFVGTAPLAGDGHVNISPKGPIDTFSVLGPKRVAYLDLVGSGAETIAHLRENGRLVIMFCSFEGPPRIVRLHGRGEFVTPGDPRFDALLEESGLPEPGVPETRRTVVVMDVERIATSCGYGVPLMDHRGERPHLDAYWAKQIRTGGSEAVARYQDENNVESIDGLPALEPGAAPSAA